MFDVEGHDSVKMFHIVNLWGNISTLLGGVVLPILEVWIGENIEDYQTYNYKDTYTKLAAKYPNQPLNMTEKDDKFEFIIKNLIYDESKPAYQLALELGTNGKDKHFGDQ